MFALENLERALGAGVTGERREVIAGGVSIDSRTIKPNDVFFAIAGKNLDGHKFLAEARDKGAAAFVVARDSWDKVRYVVNKNIFLVKDTTVALGRLGKYHHLRFPLKRLGITGSCGKTTTKQIASLLLSRQFRVFATEGNLNNQFGLPLNCFRVGEGHDLFLAELGASRPGDIKYLTDILEPELGLITNIHPAHLEGFGSLSNVYDTKLELAGAVGERGGTIILHGDNRELVKRAKKFAARIVTFGRWGANDYGITASSFAAGVLEFEVNRTHKFLVKTGALFNLENFLAAIALANQAGVSMELLEGEISGFSLPPGRFEFHAVRNGITVIHDAYNANPGSMIKSLESFSELEGSGQRKIAVLGDMKELGPESRELHAQIGREMTRFGIPVLITVGEEAAEIAKRAGDGRACEEIYTFPGNPEAIAFLAGYLRSGDMLFLKASRSMKLESILESLQDEEPAGRSDLITH